MFHKILSRHFASLLLVKSRGQPEKGICFSCDSAKELEAQPRAGRMGGWVAGWTHGWVAGWERGRESSAFPHRTISTLLDLTAAGDSWRKSFTQMASRPNMPSDRKWVVGPSMPICAKEHKLNRGICHLK